MNVLQSLTEEEITEECGEEIVNRADEYIGTDRLCKRLVLPSKSIIQAEISGNYCNYRVGLSNDEDKFLEPFCTCPADMHFCKHAAALGVTWIRDPETFFDMDSLTEILKKKSRQELEELIVPHLEPGRYFLKSEKSRSKVMKKRCPFWANSQSLSSLASCI